jgi:hypothetical protein
LVNEIASLTEKIQLCDKQVEKLAREKVFVYRVPSPSGLISSEVAGGG